MLQFHGIFLLILKLQNEIATLIIFSGQLKMSLGSGSFLDVNTGQDVHASIRGLVPLVGWKMGSELVYFAEGKILNDSQCSKIRKKVQFQKYKTHFLLFQKWQKIHFWR